MTKRIIPIILLTALLSSLLMAGCRPGQEPVPNYDSQGKTVNLYGIDPLTLDPALSAEMTSQQYIRQIFSGLVRPGDNLEPAPDIAQRWEISEDGRTYTFHLQSNVRFQDGRKVKAEDFQYSWQRAADPTTGSSTAATYLGDIVGVREVLAGRSKQISGVKVIDDVTLQVTIDAAKSYFLSKLTYPTAFVVDRTNIESTSKWWDHPNGTGPFKLRQWDENNLLVLEKNALYYGQVAGVDFAIFHLWGGVPMSLYETGKIDVTGVSLDYVDTATDHASPFYQQLAIVPELSLYYIGFNTTKPPFDDVYVRRAFSQAIDKSKLVSLVFKDMVLPAKGILPPGLPGFNKELRGVNYDVARAKELIKSSRYGDISRLPPITVTTQGWGGSISAGLEAVIHEWQQNLGVEVKVRQLEPERFLYHLDEEKDEMFDMGWVADYPHQHNFLDLLFHSGADNNYGEYRSPEVDALLERARLASDTKISSSLYQQAEQKLIDDAACLPLWFGRNYLLVKPYVKGYKLNPLGFAMLNMVSVEPD